MAEPAHKTYPYGAGFQDKILALMVREPQFLAAHASVIQPEYFDSEYHSALARMMLQYYAQHKQSPTRDVLLMLITEYVSTRALDSTYREYLESTLDLAFSRTDLTDAKDVRERVVEFGNTRHIERLLFTLYTQVQAGAHSNDLWKTIDHTRSECSGAGDLGIFMQDVILDAPRLLRESDMYKRDRKVALFLPTFDEAFYGGLGRGELGVILGYTNFGKSMFLVNLGAAGVFQKLPIVHFTVGEMEELDILARYASRLSGTPLVDMLRGNDESDVVYRHRVNEILVRYGMNINVKKLHPGTDVATLRSHLSQLRAERMFQPALVLIDNADDLAAATQWVKESSYEHLGAVYTELKDMASDFSVAMWVDSQTNRSAPTFEIADMDVIADSHKKARKADVVISVNQRVDERKSNTVRLALIKARRYSKTNRVVRCSIDYNRMMLKEAPPSMDEEPAAEGAEA